MKMTFGGYPLYAPDIDGQLYQQIGKYIWPMMLTPAQSERGFVYSKACEPLEPLRTRRVTPCPALNLYQMYYPWGWDNYARMWVLMRKQHFVNLTKRVPGTDVQLGPAVYPNDNIMGFPAEWNVYPLRCSWAQAAPIKSTAIPLPFGGFTFIFAGSIYSIEMPMVPNRVVKVGAGIDWQAELKDVKLEIPEGEPPLDTIYLVELVDFRYRLRQQLAPYVSQTSPSWQQFVSAITSGLPQLRQLLESPASGTLYASLATPASMPDMSQLNRPGTPVTQILDCLPTGLANSTGRDLIPTAEKPKRKNLLAAFAFDDPELNFVVENDSEAASYKTFVVDYLFPRYINGRHRPELPPYKIAGEVPAGASAAEVERISMTSSQPARFASADDDCPYNLAALRLLASQDLPLITRHLGSTTSFPRRFSKDWLDFYLFEFINGSGPIAIRKNLSPTQYRMHSYNVAEQLPKACDDVRRVRLLENLPACSDAMAYILTDGDVVPTDVNCSESGSGSGSAEELTDNCPCNNERLVLVRDTAGIARSKISRALDDGIQNATRYAPSNSMGFARPLRCAGTNSEFVYELISVGQGCCEESSSGAEDCCEQWFTRFENLGMVINKPLGSVIAYGETVGQAKSSGDAYIRYMAYLASSASPPGCAIDLSSIHSFPTQNSRMEGSEPCTNTYSECSIEYAKTKMRGRLPVDGGSCSWYEDLSQPVTLNYYHSRMLRSNPATCAYGKKVYNFTSVLTTLESVGPDYVVLKHTCPSPSSESSGGPDPCCAVLTDHDVRCIGGKLQRWKKETEVCWDGECLVTRVISDWANTGQNAGCCSCGSESSSLSSSAAEPSSCCLCDLTQQSYPALIHHEFTGRIGGVFTRVNRSERITLQKQTVSPGNCRYFGTGSYTTNFDPGPSVLHFDVTVTCNVPFTCLCSNNQQRTVAVKLEYRWDNDARKANVIEECCEGFVPPPGTFTQALCPQTATCNPLCLSWTETDCKQAVHDRWSSGNLPDNYRLYRLNIGCGVPRPTFPTARLVMGGNVYNFGVNEQLPESGLGLYHGTFETSTIPSQLLDEAMLGGSSPTSIRFVMSVDTNSAIADEQSGWTGSLYYELLTGDQSVATAGVLWSWGQTPGGSGYPFGITVSNTGSSQKYPGIPFNTDCPWSLSTSDDSSGMRLSNLISTGVASDRQATFSGTLSAATTTATALTASVMATSAVQLDGVRVYSGSMSAFSAFSLAGASVTSSGTVFV
jgi:hypothetical protein